MSLFFFFFTLFCQALKRFTFRTWTSGDFPVLLCIFSSISLGTSAALPKRGPPFLSCQQPMRSTKRAYCTCQPQQTDGGFVRVWRWRKIRATKHVTCHKRGNKYARLSGPRINHGFVSLSLFPGELLRATTSGKSIAETHIWLVYIPNRTSSNLAFFVAKVIQTHYTVPSI